VQKNELQDVTLSSTAISPDVVNVKILNYRPQSGNVFQNIFVSNFSVKASRGQLQWSSARDRLSDSLKQSTVYTYGFYPESPESAVPGFADLFLYNAGINISQYNLLYCATNQMGSSTNDMIVYNDARYAGSPTTTLGLRNCEKSYMGLNLNKFDHNNNGIPDYLEIRCGLNPLNMTQAFTSTAGDGVSNIDKCKMNIPIDESVDTESNKLFAYKYQQNINADGSVDFSVTNIPVLNEGEENMLVFYVTETNLTTKETSLYTAYAIVRKGYVSKTLQFDYWATTAANFTNQEIIVPAVTQ
jgi:hypothetical protein